MNSAASRQVVMPPMPADRQAARFGRAGNFRHHVHRDRFHRRAAIAAMGALAVDHRLGAEKLSRLTEVIELIVLMRDTASAPPRLAALGWPKDIGDVRRQLDDAGHAAVLFHPSASPSRYIPAPAPRPSPYRVRPSRAGSRSSVPPRRPRCPRSGAGCPSTTVFIAGHHQADDHRPVAPLALDLLDLLQVHLQRAVGDEFDVVQAPEAADPHPRSRRSGGRSR